LRLATAEEEEFDYFIELKIGYSIDHPEDKFDYFIELKINLQGSLFLVED